MFIGLDVGLSKFEDLLREGTRRARGTRGGAREESERREIVKDSESALSYFTYTYTGKQLKRSIREEREKRKQRYSERQYDRERERE